MNIFFRVDANGRSASGHVVRCITLADAFEEKNIHCEFIVADEQSTWLIKERGYKFAILNSQYNKMDDELENLVRIIREKEIRLMVIDSYFVTEYYFNILSKFTKLIYINDIFEIPFSVDMLITYGNLSTRINYKAIYKDVKDKKPYVLQGREYTPLRKEFQNSNYNIRDKVRNVFITVGGSDRNDFLFEVIGNLCEIKSLNYHVVVGVYNESIRKIKDVYGKKNNVNIYERCNCMCELMNKCDIAITAGGTTLYELCSVSVPAICVCLDSTQEKIVEEMRNKEIVFYAGNAITERSNALKNIVNGVCILSEDYSLRKKYADKMHRLVDGNGTQRIINKIIEVFKINL